MSTVVAASAEHRLAARRYEVERWVAAVAVLLSFTTINLSVARLTIPTMVVLALAPVWIGSLRRFSGALPLVWASVAALAAGAAMALLAAPDRDASFTGGLEVALLLVTTVGRIGVLLWARTRLSAPTVAILAGVAMLATVSPDSSLFGSNPWKFGFALPVTVLSLAIAWRIGRRWLEMVVLTVLAAISATNDARSGGAILGLALLVVAWQAARSGHAAGDERARWAGTAIVVAALGWVVYHLVEGLILAGALGESTQQRTQAQLEAGGSLLLGGRPELAATVALMRESPWGFGLGVKPSLQDILVAKSGMASINYDPNNGYVETYMLGSGFSLHSIVGDLWANFGGGGVVLCAVLAWVTFRAVLVRVRLKRASGLVVFLACSAAWSLGFGPFRSSVLVLALLVGLALVPAREHDDARWDRPVDAASDG
ncbi:hypothetical protein [Aeromicrobium sp. 179-A 4D2 NHS]|uniref:hypothetical protein n=1 Tax=Aeromicrobium sp. 179-A 4D2 NHS TaxID=3142375 RepID=UPI0039A24671